MSVMRRKRLWWMLLALGLGACAAPATPLPPTVAPVTPSSVPSAGLVVPTYSGTPFAPADTRLNLACAGPDNSTLAVKLYGAGSVAVIFSNRSDKGQDRWKPMAAQTAAAGYLAVTYDYRGHNADNSEDISKLDGADLDLQAVIACARAQGAPRIVLVGASLGGIASAKVAGAVQAAALIVIGSPMSHPDFTLKVSAADLQNSIPKLFIASQQDTLVPAADTQAMYDAAAEPKTFYQYPGDAHGTDLLLGASAADFQQRLLAFITTNAAAHP